MIKNRLLRFTAVAALLTLLAGSVGNARAAHSRSAGRTVSHAPTTLVYGTTEEPDTLNPLITVLATAFDLNAGVFDELVKADAHDNFIPDLATSWSVSPDNLTYTFHLRHGVKWADGVPFTAKDVYFTYQQEANPKNNKGSFQNNMNSHTAIAAGSMV